MTGSKTLNHLPFCKRLPPAGSGLAGVLLVVALGHGAYAQSSSAGEDPVAGDDETITIEVPKRYHGRGYSLRYMDRNLPLEKKQLKVERPYAPVQLDLLSPSGRILATDNAYLDAQVFRHLEPAFYRLHLFYGETVANGEAFRGIFQTGHFGAVHLGFNYQPGPFGFMVSLVTEGTTQDHDVGISSDYTSRQQRLLATWETAPFAHSLGTLKRLHSIVGIGALHASHDVELSDGHVTISGSSKNWGGVALIDLWYPIASFRLALRGALTYQQIEIPEVALKTESVQRNLSVGVGYAF